MKVRIDPGVTGVENALPALDRGREVADATGSFMMVHVARSPIPMAGILDRMRPGDIVTHAFHGAANNILDSRGRLRSEVLEARSKGVLMDVGAASANVDVEVTKAAIAQGFLPDTISSDITKPRPARPVILTLPELMSMFMGMGMSLEQVVTSVTRNGAAAIGLHDEIGTLRPRSGRRRRGPRLRARRVRLPRRPGRLRPRRPAPQARRHRQDGKLWEPRPILKRP